MPNDERENDRMGKNSQPNLSLCHDFCDLIGVSFTDMQHHMFLMTLGGRLGISPPCQPGAHIQRALDVGTGTGIWAIQYAEDHPEATVSHTDDSS